jgi:PAS domain S-box-containing protein
LEDLTAVARELGRFDAEDGLVHMLASLVTASQEFIGIADLEGNALFVNEAGRKLVGLKDLDEVRSTRIVDYFSEKDQPRILREVMSVVARTGFWQGELSFRNFATGAIVPVLYNIFPVRDPSGAIAAYGTVTRDLTVSKAAEQRLRYMASIVESSDDAIVSKDLNGRITSWNKGAERIFGYAADEAVGRSITMVIPADRQNEEVDILARLRRGERVDHFETVRRCKDGSLIVVSLTISPVKDEEGEIVGASKIARDITEQKRSQEQIAALAREAEHRSKNLIASVRAILYLSRSETAEGLKKALEGRFRALENVNSLFVEARWIGAELSAIAAQELAPYSAGNHSRIRIDGPPVSLEPNAAQALAITLHELATNAAKYGCLSQATGHLNLTWHRTDGRLAIRWMETDGPTVQKPTHRGFGTRVIEQMIAQVSGEAEFDWRPEGLICEITIPI